jgi:hypothetical protein
MEDEKSNLSSEQSSDHAAADAFRRRVEELYGGPIPEPPEPLPPSLISLSAIKSEYQNLCDELGGPVEGIGPNIERSTFERCCGKYGPEHILPVLLLYKNDRDTARRHWPHAAFAINQYVYEIGERKTYTEDEPTPGKIEELLSQIARFAKDLNAALSRLQKLAGRLNDPTAPDRRGHIGWLDAFISQAAAGVFSNDVDESPEHRGLVDLEKLAFLRRLAEVEATATRAIDRTDRERLERERGLTNPALFNFVLRCGKIWESLTGRPPSAERVERADGSQDPQFVLLMQGLAGVGGATELTRNHVAACLNHLTPKTTR